MRPLAPSDREALDLRWGKLRTAAQRAEAASAAWNKLNDELMAKWRKEGLDDLAISNVKAVNLALSDAWSLYSFCKGEVERHSADIQAELAYRTLVNLGQDEVPAAGWPLTVNSGPAQTRRKPPPIRSDDSTVTLSGLVEPGPLTDPALVGHATQGGAR